MTSTQAAGHQESERETTGDPEGCGIFSWSPEVHDHYGDAEGILSKLEEMRLALGDRRVYLLVIAGDRSAEVRFFERVDDKNWAVSGWRGADLGDLHARIAQTVLDNRGIHCVGEQVKALVNDTVALELEGIVPAPASARAAFAHSLRSHGENQFIRATTALLC